MSSFPGVPATCHAEKQRKEKANALGAWLRRPKLAMHMFSQRSGLDLKQHALMAMLHLHHYLLQGPCHDTRDC